VFLAIRWLRHRGNFFTHKIRSRPAILARGEWTHRFVNLNLTQVQLHYVETGAGNGKPLMVCVHGFPEFWYSWRFQLRHFKKDYHVVAVDQRGYGESQKPAGISNYKVEMLADDIRQLILALGYEKAIVLGHDWGGVVVWKLAIDHPEVVDRLIALNCPHPSAFGKLINTSWKQFFMSWYMFMVQCPWLPETLTAVQDFKLLEDSLIGMKYGVKNRANITDEDMEAWKYVFSQPGALTPPLNYYRAGMQRWSMPTVKRQLTKPLTLLLWGTDDQYLSIDGAKLTPSFCERCEVRYVEGASHWVQQDEPDQCNRLIEQFLLANKDHIGGDTINSNDTDSVSKL